MKYNTISSSNLASEGKKSTLKIYTIDTDISQKNKMTNTEVEIATVRGELEIVQKALKLQTKRCRQLVSEYTRRLQQKEQQYQCEKSLRDDQLAKVLRALIIFEARLKQEQKFISNQLKEKDYIIKKQNNEIQKLLSQQYCKNCNQYYNNNNNNSANDNSPNSNLESLDSSSEYIITDYQSSNFESLDSSSDIYATISEKSYNTEKSDNSDSNKIFIKNISSNNGRKLKKIRKNSGNYFEILKVRTNNFSPYYSNDDNTSNDYDHLDSLPTESVISGKIDNDETIKENDSSSNLTISECNNTVIVNNIDGDGDNDASKLTKISESIPVFESGDDGTNDNWYASASDQEDEQQRDIYRNNPVLECMNQILLQNINDSMNSPSVERKLQNKNKKVKFSDEEDNKQQEQPPPPAPTTTTTTIEDNHDYYETPIQKLPNYYETPQSIYSNDYEQILSKCSETFTNSTDQETTKTNDKNHLYVDLDAKIDDGGGGGRKVKISRTPPALPPKPANLMLKYKRIVRDTEILESEPDYCSISELNLPPIVVAAAPPPIKNPSFKKINVIAEINPPNSQDVINKIEKANFIKTKQSDDCNPIMVNDEIPNLIVKKCVEKLNIQLAKQTTIKSDLTTTTPVKNKGPEIPKLPQVSEIIIPEDDDDDDGDDKKQQEECINHDNYIKNNSQILKMKQSTNSPTTSTTTQTTTTTPTNRRSILMGTSVSSLITGFNNQQLISEIQKKPEHGAKPDKRLFTSFENLQNLNKQSDDLNNKSTSNFDLSQNFEEFKLDDCEIEEYKVDDLNQQQQQQQQKRVDLIRATPTNDSALDNFVSNLNKTTTTTATTIDLLKQQLEKNKSLSTVSCNSNSNLRKSVNEPTYEYFLECTGLSSKSILTPSRLLSNHKSMLKPKDIKLRSKVKSNSNLFDRNSTSTIRYWSEPYI